MTATIKGVVPIETLRAEVLRVLTRHGRGQWLARQHLALAVDLPPYQLARALRLMVATEEIERRPVHPPGGTGRHFEFRLPPEEVL